MRPRLEALDRRQPILLRSDRRAAPRCGCRARPAPRTACRRRAWCGRTPGSGPAATARGTWPASRSSRRSATCSTAWLMVRAAASRRPTWISAGSRMMARAKPQDLVRHRRREEQRLALGRQRVDDAPDVGPEAHVQHAVGFVEDQRLEAVELGARAHVIHQAAGRRDDERDAGGEGPRLRLHRRAAVDGHAADAGVVAEALDVVVDLDGQLAGRRQHQHAGAGRVGRRPGGVGGGRGGQQPIDQRQHERRGLAGAGLGAGDDVAAAADQRQHRRLDRRGVREAAVADARDQVGVEAERLERERLGVRDRELAGRFDRGRGNRRGSGRFRGAGRAGTAAGRTATGLSGRCSQADVVWQGSGRYRGSPLVGLV